MILISESKSLSSGLLTCPRPPSITDQRKSLFLPTSQGSWPLSGPVPTVLQAVPGSSEKDQVTSTWPPPDHWSLLPLPMEPALLLALPGTPLGLLGLPESPHRPLYLLAWGG
ncbi:Hypothetical predicted protein [Marmota monax]|uniref:Uncharacterized protein n=1 Tax=Marmota monax TaxID=9995 RepID=A0A5E4CXC1_MARMO|nr:hypothetical protein GHT09_004868 [Marmota monax]VTJ85661.1 Hypothetical predicted protein [Marmota monax]